MPLAEEENRTDEIKNALALLALHDGKLDAALVRGLVGELPQVRAIAAEGADSGRRQGGTAPPSTNCSRTTSRPSVLRRRSPWSRSAIERRSRC